MAQIIAGIGFISSLYTVYTIPRDLFFTEPSFTLEDIRRQMDSSNAHYFQGEHLTNLLSARNRFYSVTKASFDNADNIVRNDLLQGGRLYYAFDDLRTDRDRTDAALAQLLWLAQNNTLHIDDHFRLVRIFVDGYSTLMHMQGVFLWLWTIYLGVPMTHSNMVPELNRARFFLENALEATYQPYRVQVEAKRSDMVGPVVEEWSFTHTMWYFNEAYRAEASTQQTWRLASTRQPRLHNIYWPNYATAQTHRNTHLADVNYLVWDLLGRQVYDVRYQYSRMVTAIDNRISSSRANELFMITFPSPDAHKATFEATIPYMASSDGAPVHTTCSTSLLSIQLVFIGSFENTAPTQVSHDIKYTTGFDVVSAGELTERIELKKHAIGLSIDSGSSTKVFAPRDIEQSVRTKAADVESKSTKYFYQKKYTMRSVLPLPPNLAKDEAAPLDLPKDFPWKECWWSVMTNDIVEAEKKLEESKAPESRGNHEKVVNA